MLADAWELAADGAAVRAADECAAAAAVARTHEMSTLEMHALHTAVRFGALTPVVRLAELSRNVDTELAVNIAAHSDALSRADGHAIDAAVREFERLGAMALAADASAQAAIAHVRGADRLSELRSSARARWLAENCGLSGTPALTALAPYTVITERERQLVTLVGSGLSNREIAERLGVSVRTVENALYRVFAKLGVARREELASLSRLPV